MKDRKQTYSEENPNGRWRKFTAEEVYSREQLKLDFKWIDLEEKDDRTVTELLSDMEDKATAIAGQFPNYRRFWEVLNCDRDKCIKRESA